MSELLDENAKRLSDLLDEDDKCVSDLICLKYRVFATKDVEFILDRVTVEQLTKKQLDEIAILKSQRLVTLDWKVESFDRISVNLSNQL